MSSTRLVSAVVMAVALLSQAAGPATAGGLSPHGLPGTQTITVRMSGHLGSGAVAYQHAVNWARAANESSNQGRIAHLAVIQRVSAHGLRVRWIPWTRVLKAPGGFHPLEGGNEATGLGTLVSTNSVTWLQLPGRNTKPSLRRASNLSGLRPGMTIFVGGDRTATGVRARIVSSLAGGQTHPVTTADQRRAHTFAGPIAGPRGNFTSEADFPGKDRSTVDYGYRQEWGGNGIRIFDLYVVSVDLKYFNFKFGVGNSWNWIFNFSATPNALVKGQPGSASINVTSSPTTNRDSYRAQFGITVGVKLNIHTRVGCGFLGLGSCDFGPEPSFTEGSLATTRGAAPLTGRLEVGRAHCITIGIFSAKVVGGIKLRICVDEAFNGAPFKADVSATGATAAKTTMSFTGTPQSYSLTPTSSPLTLTLNNFYWGPIEDMYLGIWFGLDTPIYSKGYDFPRIRLASPLMILVGPQCSTQTGSGSRIPADCGGQPAQQTFSLTAGG